jgi:hypothetical protein
VKPGFFAFIYETLKRIRLDLRKVNLKTMGRIVLLDNEEVHMMNEYVTSYESARNYSKQVEISLKFLKDLTDNKLENKKEAKLIK